MPQIAGGCLCGKVRYSANTEPAFVGVCHCRDCQKFTGSAFAVAIAAAEGGILQMQGKLATYSKTGDIRSVDRAARSARNVVRRSPMSPSALPGVVMIASGTLDDASWVKPGMEIYCDSAQPWVHLGGEMKQFAKMPG